MKLPPGRFAPGTWRSGARRFEPRQDVRVTSESAGIVLTLEEAQAIWKALLDVRDRIGDVESVERARETIEKALARADGPPSFTEL
jgi:hypothetical protein